MNTDYTDDEEDLLDPREMQNDSETDEKSEINKDNQTENTKQSSSKLKNEL